MDLPDDVEAALVEGGRLFEAGAYFQAHERWEDAWRGLRGRPEARGVQGLVQLAVALHHLGSGEPRRIAAAARVAARGLAKLQDAEPALGSYRGLVEARWRARSGAR